MDAAAAIAWIFVLVYVATTIWVFFDAPARGMSRAWAIGCFLLWFPLFPIYLVARLAGTKRQAQLHQPPQAELAPAQRSLPAGQRPDWYPDPWFPGRFRYWDGERWTSNSSGSPKG